MTEKVIAGYTVNVTEEGYLVDASQWNKEIAGEIAKELEIEELTEGHWKIIEFLQKDVKEKGKIPTIRRIKKVGGIDTKELYKLFPDGPVKKAAKIAGLSKPESCI